MLGNSNFDSYLEGYANLNYKQNLDLKGPSLLIDRDHVDLIIKSVDGRTYQAGQSYFQEGRVLSFEAGQFADKLTSKVKGSGRSIYQLLIRFDDLNGKLPFTGVCTCPVGRNCKHMVASLLAYFDGGPSPNKTIDVSDLTYEMRQWL